MAFVRHLIVLFAGVVITMVSGGLLAEIIVSTRRFEHQQLDKPFVGGPGVKIKEDKGRIIERFNTEGIEFAFPTRTLHLAGDDKRSFTLA